MNTQTDSALLTRDDVLKFHEQGYLGPYEVEPPLEMTAIRDRIDREVLSSTGPDPRRNGHARHLDHRVVYDLVSGSPIIDRIRCLFGEDIILWSSNFFNKEPGGAEIPWHQDIHSWPIEPTINISAWIAIDDVDVENSCVQLIPGSHRRVARLIPPSADVPWSSDVIDPDEIPADEIVNMELTAGQFFIFNERMLHHSSANNSTRRRLGLAARYTVPFVRLVDQDGPPLFSGHRCIVVSGEDQMNLNRMGLPPAP